jgi:hypothetical protein
LDLLKRHSGIVWDPGRFAGLLGGGDVRRLGNPAGAPALGLTPGNAWGYPTNCKMQHALVTKDDKGPVAMHALTQRAVRGLTDAPEREALVAAVAGALHAKLVKFDYVSRPDGFSSRQRGAGAPAISRRQRA